MVTYMKHNIRKVKYLLLLIVAVTAGVFFLQGNQGRAADAIYITYNGQDLNPSDTLPMTSSSLQLMLRSDGNIYENDDRYRVTWSIEDSAVRDVVASIEQSSTNKAIASLHALSPGMVTVTVTVTDNNENGAVMGSVTCNINVMFAIDTSNDANLYRFVNEQDTERSLIMAADHAPVPLKLNFGDANRAQWISANEEVVKGDQKTGVVTPVGAGRTQITATYTPADDPSATYTALLNVYIKPRISLKKDGEYKDSLVDQILTTGSSIYTDTIFTNNSQAIRNKIIWVVKQDDGKGNPKVLADSLGKESDLIKVTPMGMYENELKINGTAGRYVIEFYVNGTYTDENNHSKAYDPTVITFTLSAQIGDKEETLGSGDSLNLPQAFGMTTDDFVRYFISNNWTKDGGPISNYATYDTKNCILTVKNNVSEGVLIDEVKVKPEYKNKVAELMGFPSSDASIPMVFRVIVNLKDQLRLNTTNITLSEKAQHLLVATYNGTYDEPVKWTSSDSSYVTVDDNGLITAVKNTKGDVTITASLTNSGGKTITATCLVVVEPALTSFSLEPNVSEMSMFVGDSVTIKAVIKQAITNAPLSWSCSTANSKIFTVVPAADGKSAIITATGTGYADLVVENTVYKSDRKTIRITVHSAIESISLKNTEMSVEHYKEGYNMGKNDVTYTPANATDKDLIWTSSNTSVATVDQDGYISFVNAGTTLITVRPVNNPNGIMSSCLLTVIGSAKKVVLSEKEFTFNVGDTHSVTVDFEPINTVAQLTWTLTGETKDCVTILPYDEERRIASFKGKSPGVSYVNITSPQTGTDTIKITVKQPSTGLTLNPRAMTIKSGEKQKIDVKLTPADSTDSIVWKSYDSSVATVDANGVVTGVKSGSTFIEARAFNGTIAGTMDVIQVTVQDGVTSVSQDAVRKTVHVGKRITLVPIFNPSTAYNKKMTWSVADSGIASIKPFGESNVKVSGVKPGTTMVTGVSEDCGLAVSYLIDVLPQETKSNTKVTVRPATKYLQLGKSFYITASVTGTSNKKVTWTSSKKKVATVSTDGKVKGKKVGTAYIKAKAQDGSGAYARCKVCVVRKATKIKLNRYTGKVLVGNTLKLKASVQPKKATIRSVLWSSSNKAVATVSSSGRILGVAEGIVKIRAKAKDGSGKSATCIVRVSEPVEATGISVENNQITVAKGKTAQSGITLNPSNSTTKITYHSDNPKVATVNKYGKITTKRAGQATIYGKTPSGLYGYCDVLVVDLNRKAVTLRKYDTEQLAVNEIRSGVTWYSKDINVATVSSSGLVTGRKKGTTTVYAIVNGVKLGCRVTVKKV